MREKLFDYKAQGITSPKALKQEFSWHLKKKRTAGGKNDWSKVSMWERKLENCRSQRLKDLKPF